jgi:ubiquinone/menaquinone biosynthesis C-methylase UbiE
MRIKTTKQHSEYWKNRKIDWKESYLSTWNHPHRKLIIQALKTIDWFSLWEVGCGPGANLVKITQELPGHQLGGSDINEEAIELARKTFNGGRFHVESSDNILLSDNSVDVMLSDAHLIYFGPTKIKKVLSEMIRSTRKHIILFEYHEKSWWKRILIRWQSGYNAYDYSKLLEEMGCYSVQIAKMPPQYWPDTMWGKYGHIIIAKKA